MNQRSRNLLLPTLFLIAVSPVLARDGRGLAVYFQDDPLAASSTVLVGAAADRSTWQRDNPAFPGDRPGSLTAVYDALEPAGLLGFPLEGFLDQDAPFTAAAMFVIHSDGFTADPNGFFQISWGLWNSETTGLERTGDFSDFSGDTFDLLEFDYFPNVSPFFGGPFVSPTMMGEANSSAPSFPFVGSFANITFASAQADLPLDEPLLSLMEHRPQDDVVVVSVFRIRNGGQLIPITGAVASMPLEYLTSRGYRFDVAGLTLWQDGFSGGTPSVFARVTYHGIIVLPELLDRPERILHVPPQVP